MKFLEIMLETAKNIFMLINEWFTFYCLFPVVLVLGLYLSLKLNFVQITRFFLSFKCLLSKKQEGAGNISHFEAVSAVLAGNFGTGNISGMAVALTMGGPGALIWMWLMAFLGGALQYASCFLAVKYRTKNDCGEYVGGPMYYLEKSFGGKKAAIVFAFLTLFGAITVGGFAQINSMMLPLQRLGVDTVISSIAIALCVAVVILGGMQRLAKFTAMIVPPMALLYLGGALSILFMKMDLLPYAFSLMWQSAFSPQAAIGGAAGITVLKAISTGLDRGLFATDVGTGTVPILQASARSHHPVIDGLVALVAPFLVMIVCTVTGLALIVTGAWQQSGLQSTNIVIYAFEQQLGTIAGSSIVVVSLLLFGYTTILAWAYCGEKAAEYLFGKKRGRFFTYCFIALLPIGSCLQVELVWTLADLCITGMLATNMIGIASLAKEVIEESRSYFNKNVPVPVLE